MRALLYNIEYLEGTTQGIWQYLDFYHVLRPRFNLDKNILTFLENQNADVIGLVEVDGGNFRHNPDMITFFKNNLGFKDVCHGIKYGYDSLARKIPVLKNQENALITKNKLLSSKKHMLSVGSKRLILEASVELDEEEKSAVTFLLVHLALFKKTRAIQIKELCSIINKIKTPVILMGDFNTFSRKELDYVFDNTSLVDSFAFRQGGKLAATEPSWNPRYRLDNILVTKNIKVNNYEILDVHYSDHLPVLIDFNLKK